MPNEAEFKDKAGDVARYFNLTKSAVYRMTREGRLPPGTFVYLNERTARYSIPRIKRAADEGAFSKPREKNSAVVKDEPGGCVKKQSPGANRGSIKQWTQQTDGQRTATTLIRESIRRQPDH
jgi:hypothetical protein